MVATAEAGKGASEMGEIVGIAIKLDVWRAERREEVMEDERKASNVIVLQGVRGGRDKVSSGIGVTRSRN